jgi:DNA-binding transcriptional ArsR family regulator
MDDYRAGGDLLKTLSHATRLAILDILRDGEQCVCHVEATLGLRQAYISQHLMVLKQAGLVDSRRDGLNLYYRVVKPEVFRLLDELPAVTGVTPRKPRHKHSDATCPCPKCAAEAGTKRDVRFPLQMKG